MSFTESSTLLFVVGVHRSGTSALCTALAASGVSFGGHLLGAMAGVNDEGFWEDTRAVSVNEALLALLDSSWFSLARGLEITDWNSACFDSVREDAAKLLRAGFGHGPLQAVKDPRFCLTLPFWLSLCVDLEISSRVIVINRAPLDVARSLEKRDGFPLGYGLRLYSRYRASIARHAPTDSLFVRYDDLLLEPAVVLGKLAQALPLNPGDADLDTVVRSDLRHYRSAATDVLSVSDEGNSEPAALNSAIESLYPLDETLREFARRFAVRGRELDQIGEAHTAALATLDVRDADVEALATEHRQALVTIDQRDADIKALAGEYSIALATINERDEQIREFDRRLSQLGDEHSHALHTLCERDAELARIKQSLERITKIPGVGYLLRRLRQHAQG